MMKRNPIPAALLMLLPFTAQAQEVPGFASFSARHTEHKGIGYDNGYTSVDVFLATNPGRFVFFTDLRGHVFNDGRFAANAGLGMRVGVKGNTIGANGFFDLREYPRNSEERGSVYRVGGGLEYLSSNCFEIRVNGYLPVGDSKHLRHAEFAYFQGNNAIAEEYGVAALPSIDAEVGYTFRPACGIEIYAGAMPYYLFHRFGFQRSHFGEEFGGKGRIAATLYDIVNLEVSYSYDQIYHTRVQGQVSLSLPFDFFCGWDCGPTQQTCITTCVPKYFRKVRREEIVPLQDVKNYFAIIDPETSEPFNFLFVDNTNPGVGTGTFEDPFHLLALGQANSVQRDIIYLFPGDGTSNNQNTGIVLKNYQKLIGSAASLSLNSITIPAQTPGQFPMISSNVDTIADDAVVELSRVNEVAGLSISGVDVGILNTGLASSDYLIRDNFITAANTAVSLTLDQNSRAYINRNEILSTAGISVDATLTNSSLLSMIGNNIEASDGNQTVNISTNASNTVFENNAINEEFFYFVDMASTSASALRALGNVRSDFDLVDDTYLLDNQTFDASLFMIEVPSPSLGQTSLENSNIGTLTLSGGATFVKIGSAIPIDE